MTRSAAAVCWGVVGLIGIVLGLTSSFWLRSAVPAYGSPDVWDLGAHGHGLTAVAGEVARVAGIVAAVLVVPMIVTGARVLCAVGVAAAIAALIGALVFTGAVPDDGAIGPGALAGVVGAAAMLASAIASMKPRRSSDAEPGGPPRDGRRLVYRDGVLVAIERWADGALVETDEVGPDGKLKAPR